MILELLDPVAHHRGREAELASGRGQAAQLDHANEHPHVLEKSHDASRPALFQLRPWFESAAVIP
jgi:hypothetical protein